jgi:hypothetical protein
MCTVTIVPNGDGFRLVCNRDERRDRPAARPPGTRRCGDRLATFPVDPAGGGTWIGVNDLGLVATLLNRTANANAPPREAVLSRGVIVPQLLACGSWVEAMLTAGGLDPGAYEPFRVVVVHGSLVGAVVSDRQRVLAEVFTLTVPRLFTSSSLGDRLVEEPRRALFDQLVANDHGGELRAQFRFHRHRWTQSPGLSVYMERADAATVSRTVIDVSAGRTDLSYEPLGVETVPAGRAA